MPKISAVGLFCLDKFENYQTRTCTTFFRTSNLTVPYFSMETVITLSQYIWSCTQKRKKSKTTKMQKWRLDLHFTKLATDIPLSNLGVQKVHGKFTEGPR